MEIVSTIINFTVLEGQGGEDMEAVIGLNRNVDIVISYIERNRHKIDTAMKMLDEASKKVCLPAIEIVDKTKGKLTAVQKSFKAIDKKVFTPVLDVVDKTKDKIMDIQKGIKDLDKKVLSPIIKITGGYNSKLKFLQDGLNALDNKVFSPAIEIIDKTTAKIKGVQEGLKAINNAVVKPVIELVDGTKDAIKSIKDGFDFISSSGTKVFDVVSKSASSFKAVLGMAKIETIKATLAQWGFNAAILANPVTWIVVGVIALIAAIVLMIKNWDKVKAAISKVVSWIKSIFTSVGTWLSSHWKKVVTAILMTMGPIGWGILALIRLIRTNWNAIKETAISVWQSVAGFFTGLWEGIKVKAVAAWNMIGGFITGIGDSVRGVWNNVISWLSEKFNWIKEFINKILNNPVFKFITSGVKSVIDIGGKVITGVSDWAFGKDGKQPNNVYRPQPGNNRSGANPAGNKKHNTTSPGSANNLVIQRDNLYQTPVDRQRETPVQQYKKHNNLNRTNKANGANQGSSTVNITIPKIADSIIVREDADIDKITKAIVAKLKQHSVNMGVA